MIRAMKGTKMAAATELLLEAKWRPMDSGSDSNSLRSTEGQSITFKSQTQQEAMLSDGPSTLLHSARYRHVLQVCWQKPACPDLSCLPPMHSDSSL